MIDAVKITMLEMENHAKESAPTDEAEVAALKARVAELERERDMALAERDERQKALEVTLEERTSAFSERNWAYERYDEARARVIELEQGNVRRQVALETRVAELEAEAIRREARADTARLREALEDIARVAYRGSAAASLARAALASAPSAEPTPRYMRVAEAVVMEAAFLVRHPSGPEGEDGYSLDDIAQRIETLDLAAVVAKAVKP